MSPDTDAFGGGFFDRVSSSGMTSRDSHDVAVEVQDCQAQLRVYAQRISEVENINVDLEARLEAAAREYIDLETAAAEACQRSNAHLETMQTELDGWRQLHAQHELKSQKLRKQLLRTERELHAILQKKYDLMALARQEDRAGEPAGAHSIYSGPDSQRGRPRHAPPLQLDPRSAPPDEVRRGRAILSLADFFDFPNRQGAHQ
mmetsp:Transcript_19775/g.66883  ORF Transcript_19775/g.66883 Transcript_19775/m.66883 type:complete len:203 (-) Transcript_19775:16-624(-)